MTDREIWLPSRSLVVTLTNYNDGRVRMARVGGPSGEAGFTSPNRSHLKSLVVDIVSRELDRILDELDDLERMELGNPRPLPNRIDELDRLLKTKMMVRRGLAGAPQWHASAEPGRILCPICNLSHPPDAPHCRNCGAVNPRPPLPNRTVGPDCPLCATTLVLDTAGRPAPRCPSCGWKAG